ncbi:MAG: hypothetical protein WDM79_14525 [Terricaulis sp.]
MSDLLRDLWYFAATSGELRDGEMFRREILGEPGFAGGATARARVFANARYLPAPRPCLCQRAVWVETAGEQTVRVPVSRLPASARPMASAS